MKNEIQEKLELFAANTQATKGKFVWQHAMTKRMAALLYAQEDKTIDYDAIRQSHDLIKDNVGPFSTFRGNMVLCIAAMLSLKEDGTELFTQTKYVYELMKDVKFWASDYLVVAAYQIAANAKPEDYKQAVTRARAFYDGMKSNSFFRTGQDDYIYAAMLGLSDINVKTGTDRIEQLYRHFRPEFWSGNSVQSLAQVLVLSENCEKAADRVFEIRDALKRQKLRLDRAYTLPSLGILALLPVDIEAVVQDIEEAQSFLRMQKGFGAFSVIKQELLLYAAAIIASVYAENVQSGTLTAAISTSIASIIIAQQAAMIAAMSASSTAAASSSN